MKILFLCHRFPLPPEGGGKIRALHIVRHLAASGHDVTLVSLIRSAAEARGAAEIRSLGVRVEAAHVDERVQALRMLLRLPTSQPSSFGYFYSRALAREIKALLGSEHWDLIIVHCSSMGPYVAQVAHTPKIIDFADMDSQKWLDYARHKRFPAALAYALEAKKLERAERKLARRFDLCTTISQNELDTLEGYATGTPAQWFPNGVDLDYFVPSTNGHDPRLIVFIGRMDYFPNVDAMHWFVSAVWPRLRARRSDLKLRIVGADPPRSIRRLARIAGVEVTGFVEDVRPHVAQAAVSVAPLRIARGMQNKVLECMAMGVPVVTTARVARGLGLGDGSPLRIADTVEEYERATLALVEDTRLRARLAAASRACVEAQFSWSKALERFEAAIGAALGGTQDGRSSTARPMSLAGA